MTFQYDFFNNIQKAQALKGKETLIICSFSCQSQSEKTSHSPGTGLCGYQDLLIL